jgi:hypothetical protein
MSVTTVTIDIGTVELSRYSDSHLATLWHLAQANPAPLGDRVAGELAERVGREVIRRWLGGTEPVPYRHQGRHHYADQLRRLGTWNREHEFIPHTTRDSHSAGAVDPAGEDTP